jgi:opacity protein-like surface antigen
MTKTWFYLWAAPLFLLAAPVQAQVNSVVHGFSLGAHLQGAGLDPENALDDRGGGAGIDIGYGFRNALSLFLTFGVGAMEPEEDKQGASYALSGLDIGARYSFRGEAARWRPHVEAALTTMLATFEDVRFGDSPSADVEIRGPAFTVGGGIEYFFVPRWSTGLGIRWSSGSFDEVQVGNVTVELDPEDEFDVRTTRLQLGVRYHFAGS